MPIQIARTALIGRDACLTLARLRRGAGLRRAGLRGAGWALRPVAGLDDLPRTPDFGRGTEVVVRVATSSRYAKDTAGSRVTRSPYPESTQQTPSRSDFSPECHRTTFRNLRCRNDRPGTGQRRPTSGTFFPKVTSASVQPRLAGQQPSIRGGVLRVTTGPGPQFASRQARTMRRTPPKVHRTFRS